MPARQKPAATPEAIAAALVERVPAWAAAYVSQLALEAVFSLRITRPRLSKLGDFTACRTGSCTITLNTDLGAELTLVTFLHELAHLQAWRAQRRREKPHGIRWQACYARLLEGLCTQCTVPAPLGPALLAHAAKGPAATLHADMTLYRILLPDGWRRTQARPAALPEGHALLETLAEGTYFRFKGSLFLKSGKLSRRHAATEMASGRMFLFSPMCPVEVRDVAPPTLPLLSLEVGARLAVGEEFVHRARRFRLEAHRRAYLDCTDLRTGRPVSLHKLVHVAPSRA